MRVGLDIDARLGFCYDLESEETVTASGVENLTSHKKDDMRVKYRL
ncbi:MAG TPA: hypothetical protein VE134_03605 [Methanomicrobiales archaeon]|nr:hypothetical protein [Methanomicrobiales archaeon]